MSDEQLIRLTSNELDILNFLISEVKETYGLEIFKLVNKSRLSDKFPSLGYGSFYAALKKLEREGLINSSTPEADKRKKHYKITADGFKTYQANMEFLTSLYKLNPAFT